MADVFIWSLTLSVKEYVLCHHIHYMTVYDPIN